MANQFYNLNYSPIAQGFDTGTWRTLYGDATIVNNQLRLNKAYIIHYADILRGDAVFNINIAAPFAEGNSKFGFIQYSKNVYACFKIDGTILTAETSDGITSYSEVITWEDSWTDTDTEFRIKWESGAVRFYVAGQLLVTIGESSSLNVPSSVVPNDPMSLFIASDSTDLFLLNYIKVTAIQSYLMSTGNDNSLFEPFVKESDRISISEAVTVVHTAAMTVSKVDSLSITEGNTQTIDYTHPSGLISNLSITEGVTVGSPA